MFWDSFYNADNGVIDRLTVFHYDYISVVFLIKIRASREDGTMWGDGLEPCPPALREPGNGVGNKDREWMASLTETWETLAPTSSSFTQSDPVPQMERWQVFKCCLSI